PLAQQKKELADAKADLAEKERKLERKLEHQRLLTRAEALLDKGKYAEAKKLFSQALELQPGHADTIKGLTAAEAGLLVAARGKADETKRNAEIERILA